MPTRSISIGLVYVNRINELHSMKIEAWLPLKVLL
jgi:hypothetical protein